MKIAICTSPIRPVPTSYPPFGSMAVIRSLQEAGYDPLFFDIVGLRPSWREVEDFFQRERPDVVGISAVVSTAYAHTKRLVSMLRRVLPKARIVLGGNLAASAEILHRLAGVDVCVIGEGEIVSVNLIRALESMGERWKPELLEGVKGLTFLGSDGQMRFTGYETRLPAEEVFDPDFALLERFSKIDNFITDPMTRADFIQDPRSSQPHRRGKKMATLVTAKGCVARCTFCHRWDKGYRAIPVEQIMAKLRWLIERYNVGFVMFTDENFGSDRRHTRELIRQLAPLDILWNVGGVRVRSAEPQLLRDMKAAGCVAVFYGMETGSPDILNVMEKKASLQDNLNAARWTKEAGLFTIYQMILGMPGETPRTVRQTTEFLKTVTQDSYESPRSRMSINYIQALPGTPVYEYARLKGLIGRSLEDEERYLLSISDIDAADDTKMLNFTDSDYLTVRSWRRRIVLEVMRHYHRHNKTPIPPLATFLARLLSRKLGKATTHYEADMDKLKQGLIEEYSKGGYFNLSRDLGYDVIVAYFYPLRHLILAVWLLQDELKRLPWPEFLGHLWEWTRHRLSLRKRMTGPAVSLRELVASLTPSPLTLTEQSMQLLREGR
ncbi:MAG: B12-binding domain-containing radical SAM protein [Elusimicrobia bacterium]|nr:B12-binding domain-containing radical SAM protein [Elusimicrobiota bacterium]